MSLASRFGTLERAVASGAGVAAIIGGTFIIAPTLEHRSSTTTRSSQSAQPNPPATTGRAINVVFNLDITMSVSVVFMNDSIRAFAAAVPRLVKPDQGPVHIYLRLISPNSGDDAAAVATYEIPAVRKCLNAFDQKCRNARDHDFARARARARAIATRIRRLHVRRSHTRTIIRGAFAADGDILASSSGVKWVVAATDLRPSGARPPHPEIDLRGVHVVILLACEQSIEDCQARKKLWSRQLYDDGALSVKFLTAQQGDLLFAS